MVRALEVIREILHGINHPLPPENYPYHDPDNLKNFEWTNPEHTKPRTLFFVYSGGKWPIWCYYDQIQEFSVLFERQKYLANPDNWINPRRT